MMEEGDTLFACCVVRARDGLWFWLARGALIAEFCSAYEPDWPPVDPDARINVGPYETRRAAKRDCRQFERAYMRFAQEKFPGLEIEDAPDPRTLS